MSSLPSGDRGARQFRSAHTYANLLSMLLAMFLVGVGGVVLAASGIPASRWALALSGTVSYLSAAFWLSAAFGVVILGFIGGIVREIVKARKEARAFDAYR